MWERKIKWGKARWDKVNRADASPCIQSQSQSKEKDVEDMLDSADSVRQRGAGATVVGESATRKSSRPGKIPCR
jgi:hypothetical protein